MSAVAVLNNTLAAVVVAQAEALRRAMEPLTEKKRTRVADLLRKAVLATGDDANELVISLHELLADDRNGSSVSTVSLEQWSGTTPSIRRAVDRLATAKLQFAEILRTRMADRGMSQSALAEKLGVSQPVVAAFLTGRHKPQPKTLHKLATALRCKPIDLWPR